MKSATLLLKRAFNLAGTENGEDAAYASGRLKTAVECLVLAASGLVFSAAYVFPSPSFLAWFALVPLYLIARGGGTLRAAGMGFVWGCFLSLGGFWWLREIERPVPFVMAAVLACFPMVWAAAIPALERNLLIPVQTRLRGSEAIASHRSSRAWAEIALALSLAGLWCVTEWVRSWIFTGLPWNFLGSSQWQFNTLIQICEWTGVYGISFVVAMVNLAIAMSLAPWSRRRPAVPILAAALLATSLGCGAILRDAAERKECALELKAALVQCDISQRRHATIEQANEALDVCMELSEKALTAAKKSGSKLDLVIWPETAVPYPLLESTSSFSIAYRYRLFDLIRACQTPFLVGSLDYGEAPGPNRYRPAYNAALLIDRTPQVVDSYRKEHIVPFGEFVPLGDKFPQFNKWVGMGRNLSRGSRFNPLEVKPGVYGGMSICYEDAFAYISRAHALNGANLLMVITNDAWYPKSSEPYQHFANAIFRAVETRLPLVRCGNSNYSCLISPSGKLVDSVSKGPDGSLQPGRAARETATFNVKVQERPTPTFHTRYGEIFILLCAFIAGAGALLALLNWREFKTCLLGAFDGKPPLEHI